MRNLDKIDQFKQEAGAALFTSQQAMTVTARLLQLELADARNTQKEQEVLTRALAKLNMHYLDQTASEIDALLDACGVARITAEGIVRAIESVLFDAG